MRLSASPKSYRTCCFKRGHYLRETLDEAKAPSAIMYGPGVEIVGQYVADAKARAKA